MPFKLKKEKKIKNWGHSTCVFQPALYTTGMDIRQAPAARAALTLGKDMTLRDYAQGAWRMRQIGRGQRLELVAVPEVSKLVAAGGGGNDRGDNNI